MLLQAWVVRTSALRRTFVSVKGFYFQADVVGQPVTWLVPHALSQVSTQSGCPSCRAPVQMLSNSQHGINVGSLADADYAVPALRPRLSPYAIRVIG